MSTPVSAYYTVDPAYTARVALERVQREVSELLSERQQMVSAVEDMNRKYGAYGTDISCSELPLERNPTNLQEWEDYASDLRLALANLRQRIDQEQERLQPHLEALERERRKLATSQRDWVRERLSAVVVRDDENPIEEKSDEFADKEAAGTDGALKAKSVRILGRLPVLAHSELRAKAEALAAEMNLVKSKTRQRYLEQSLRRVVSEARGECEKRKAMSAEAENLMSALRRHSGDEVDQLLVELRDVAEQRGPLTDELRARAGKAVRHYRQLTDQEYTQSAVVEVLHDLGYEVGEDFVTVAPTGERGKANWAYFRHSNWGDFELGIRCDGEAHSLNCAVFFTGDSNSVSEGEIQEMGEEIGQEWCADVDPFLSELRGRGVGCEIARRVEPGAQSVPIRSSSNISSRRRSRSAAKQRRRRP